MIKSSECSLTTFSSPHSKKFPSPRKLKKARKSSREPFLVSDHWNRFRKCHIGFLGLGNLSVFENTDFNAHRICYSIFSPLSEIDTVFSETDFSIKCHFVSEKVSENTYLISGLSYREPKQFPSFENLPKGIPGYALSFRDIRWVPKRYSSIPSRFLAYSLGNPQGFRSLANAKRIPMIVLPVFKVAT